MSLLVDGWRTLGPGTPKDVQTLVVDETGLVEGKIVLPARIFSRCMSR